MDKPTKRLIKGGKSAGRWEVDFGIDEIGVRRRPTFQTEDDANDAIDTWKKEVKSYGEFWARLPQLERKSIAVIYQEIKAKQLTLARVWADHQLWSRENQQTAKEVKAYEDVITEWQKRKRGAGKSQRYIHECTSIFNQFGEGRMRQHIHEIMSKELDAWITSKMKKAHGGPDDESGTWGLSSRKTNTSLFSSLWECAVDMGWCSYNICDRLEPVQRPNGEVRIYPNETVMNIMAALMDNDLTKRVIAPVSLEFFCCMRTEEISEPPEDPTIKPFNWDDIDVKHGLITVRPGVAKPGDQRVIKVHPTGAAWIKFAEKLKNPLPPVNERRLIDQACELIGLADWIRDGLRKNCATHMRWWKRNDYDVVKAMGNSIRIMLKHYAELQTPEEVSEEYWEITPEAVEKYRRSAAWKKFIEGVAKQQAQLASGISNSAD